jgi:hypothetical protein
MTDISVKTIIIMGGCAEPPESNVIKSGKVQNK